MTACGVTASAPFPGGQVSCCIDVVEKAFSTDPSVPAPVALSGEQQACCAVLLGTSDGPTPGVVPVPWETAYRCCPYVPSSDIFSPTCTPWGPPTPPVMDAALLAELGLLAEVA